MFERNGVLLSMVACAASAGLLAFSAPARADGAGWFLGGMVTSKVLSNAERRTQAQEAQAYRPAPQPVQQVQAQPARPSKETQLQELDRLASGGYITPQEYKERRQAILSGM
jgi:ABC-type sugar transport system substrate-binding protein